MTTDLPDDDATFALLRESGIEDDPELTGILRALRASALEKPPAPSPEVRELLAGVPGARISRIGGRRRGIVTALVVTVILAGGVSAAAASPQAGGFTQRAIGLLVHAIIPGAGTGAAPTHSVSAGDPGSRPTAVPEPAEGTKGKPDVAEGHSKKPANPAASAPPRSTAAPGHGGNPADHAGPPASTPVSPPAHTPDVPGQTR